MNKDILQGRWKQFRGDMKRLWAEISDDEFDLVDGEREKLEGLIQERYGRSRDAARAEVQRFFDERTR